ncbi:hypothetical protein Godav_019857, partial [Gossypium davidsonii]|nr:hypothetical protein [Gossypium davidsonii]
MQSVKIGGSPGTFGVEVYIGSLIQPKDPKRLEIENKLNKMNKKIETERRGTN